MQELVVSYNTGLHNDMTVCSSFMLHKHRTDNIQLFIYINTYTHRKYFCCVFFLFVSRDFKQQW